jgi:hypothetical protein
MLTFPLGTQTEIPVSLTRSKLARADCSYEAVLAGTAGVNTVLAVRVPVAKGPWVSTTAYSAGDEVTIGVATYTRKAGVAVIDVVSPGLSVDWRATTANQVYIQLPKTVLVGGDLELAATELTGAFPQTLKIYYDTLVFTASPTELV